MTNSEENSSKSKLTDEQWDNLIAAAPDLYEALIAVEHLVVRSGTPEWREQVAVALAKARGEQSA